MTKASLTMVLLVAAALAGCTGGTDEGQLPIDSFTESGTTSASSSDTGTTGPRSQGRGNDQSYEAYLEVEPANGTAPLDVTLEFGVTWFDNGQHRGQQNGTGSGGNQTGNGTGNGTGSASNQTGNQPGEHDLNRGKAKGLDWTLEVRYNATASNGTGGNATGNGTGNGTAGGSNGTSTSGSTGTTTTSSSTGTTTSSTSSGTGSSGNGTGNSTGNGTGNSTGGGSGNAMAHGTVVASFNGTGEELPSNRTVTLNETGSYDAVFTVTHENGTTQAVHETIAVGAVPAGTPLGNETQVFEGSFVASEPLTCMGEEVFDWVLNGTFNGTPAEVDHVNVTVDAGGFGSVEMTFAAPNGTEIQSGEEINATGPFAPGNYTLTVSACTSVAVDFTATAVAHYATLGRTET